MTLSRGTGQLFPTAPFHPRTWLCLQILSHTHPLQQFALQERFDHVVGGGEVPRLVDEVDGLETCWEGVLGSQTQTQMVTDGAVHPDLSRQQWTHQLHVPFSI